MNRFAHLSCVCALLIFAAGPAQAAFVNGSLVLVTVANGTSTAANAVTLNSYSFDPVTGKFDTAPVSHPISTDPVTGLTLPGVSDHDGMLRLSTNGNYLTIGGYHAAVNTAGVIASSSTRAIGVVDSNWNLTTTSMLSGAYTGIALRSVASTDGQHFWTGGDQGNGSQGGGQYYVDATTGPITQTLITADDARANRIDHGQLWTASSGSGGASTVGTGLPTSAATSTLSSINGPFVKSDVVFLDLDNNGASDTAYATDGKNLLGKWHFNSNTSTWTQTGSYTGSKTGTNFLNDVNSIEAFAYGNTVQILAATQTGKFYQLADLNGINSNFDPAFLANTNPVPLFSATDGSSFRGMALIGAPVPEPMAMSLLATVISVLVCRRRSRGR